MDENTKDLVTDLYNSALEEGKLITIASYLQAVQREYALDAKRDTFKYKDNLNDCKVSASTILAMAGWKDDLVATRIFDEKNKKTNVENESGTR